MELLVGVTGYRRCGKDSTVGILTKHFGFARYGFADALRIMAAAVDPMIKVDDAPHETNRKLRAAFGDISEYTAPTAYRYTAILDALGYDRGKDIPDFRRYLQRLGTEGIRGTFGPTAWVDALALRIANEKPTRVAISDVRFASEAHWLLENQGVLWRVVRPGHGGDDPHPSEAEIPHLPATREIVADSLAELEAQVLSAAKADLGLYFDHPTTQESSNDSTSPSPSASSAHDPASPSAGEVPRSA